MELSAHDGDLQIWYFSGAPPVFLMNYKSKLVVLNLVTYQNHPGGAFKPLLHPGSPLRLITLESLGWTQALVLFKVLYMGPACSSGIGESLLEGTGRRCGRWGVIMGPNCGSTAQATWQGCQSTQGPLEAGDCAFPVVTDCLATWLPTAELPAWFQV